MPGIAGIVTRRRSREIAKQLDAMLSIMMHERYYSCARSEHASIGIHVGCVNVNGSMADCMPVWNETHDVILLMSGECFPDEDRMERLISHGHDFQKGSFSWIVHAYEDQGDEVFRELNGWFCGVIVDLKQESVRVFNDRYGQRRLYYYQDESSFYFSTEAKSLVKILPHLRSLDSHALAQFIAYNCILGDRTWFKDVRVLPPGSVWSCGRGHVQKRKAFDPRELENQPLMDPGSFPIEFEATFMRVLPRYLSGSARMLSLTGGIDTRMILALSGVLPGELPCFSHGSMYREMLDVTIARRVAQACGQQYTVIQVAQDFLENFASYAARSVFITDGLADACQAHLLYCNRAARQIGNVKITGKFGSQLLKGISALNRPSGYDADRRLVNEEIGRKMNTLAEELRVETTEHPLSVVAFQEIPWWWAGITAIEYSQLDVRSPYLDNDLVDLLFRSPFGSSSLGGVQMDIIRKRNSGLYDIMTDRGYGGGDPGLRVTAKRWGYVLRNLLAKVYGRDKLPASMQHLVARVDGRVLSPLGIDRLLLGLCDYRHYRTWFRTSLSSYIKEMLLDRRTLARPYWNAVFLKEVVGGHVEGRFNYLREIRKVLTVELIERQLIENI